MTANPTARDAAREAALVERLKETSRFIQQITKQGVGRAYAAIEDAIRSIEASEETATALKADLEQALAREAKLAKSLRLAEAQELVLTDRLDAFTRSTGEGWQSMDSAPKDGTQVIAWVPSYYQGNGGWALALFMDGKWFDSKAWVVEPVLWCALPAAPHPPAQQESQEPALAADRTKP